MPLAALHAPGDRPAGMMRELFSTNHFTVAALTVLFCALSVDQTAAHPLHGADPALIAAYKQELDARLAQNPNDAQIYMDFGHFYIAEKLYADAETAYRRAIGIDPARREALDGLAVVLIILRRPAEALEFYQRIVDSDPESVGIINTMAFIHGDLGQKEEEIRLLRTSLERNPRQRGIARRLAMLCASPQPESASPLPRPAANTATGR